MELEKGKVYKAIFNEKIVDIEVLKKNKKSYSVKLNKEKETLWIDNDGLSIKVNEFVRYSTYTTYRKVEIVSEKEANIYILQRNVEICRGNQTELQKQINELLEKVEKLQLKRDEYIEKAKYYSNKLLKLKEVK